MLLAGVLARPAQLGTPTAVLMPGLYHSVLAPPGELYDAAGCVPDNQVLPGRTRARRITGQHNGLANAASALQDLPAPPYSPYPVTRVHLLALVTYDDPHLMHGPPVAPDPAPTARLRPPAGQPTRPSTAGQILNQTTGVRAPVSAVNAPSAISSPAAATAR